MALRLRLLAAALCVLPVVSFAETGQEAFARQDYARAADLWRQEADGGSAEAGFGLGLLHDLGLGRPRNPSAALQWYLQAAAEGHADAQFNVAVLLDAGTAGPADPAAAAVWYARAAAKGHARARYNLGLLYEAGQGVPRNPDLARAWFEAASPALPAAADRLAALPPARPTGGVPQAVAGTLLGPENARRAELVWTAAGAGRTFRVEVVDRAAPGDAVLRLDVDRSALAADLPEGGALAWRVGRLAPDGTVAAWSDWADLLPARSDEAAPSPSRLAIEVSLGDRLAAAYAEELARIFAETGIGVVIRRTDATAAATTVDYAHEADAALASSVAAFLPGLGPEAATRAPEGTPGLVRLRLAGGPQPPGPPQPPGASQTSTAPGGGTGR